MIRPCTVVISGKGGTGKTTIASLLIDALIAAGKRPILAVDADPNANLHEALGIALTETLGSMREEAFTRSIPPRAWTGLDMSDTGSAGRSRRRRATTSLPWAGRRGGRGGATVSRTPSSPSASRRLSVVTGSSSWIPRPGWSISPGGGRSRARRSS